MLWIFKNGAPVNVNGQTGSGAIVYLKDFKITRSKDGRELRFTEHISEIVPTFPKRARVELYDTTARGGEQAAPGIRRFFGYVDSVEPHGHEIHYVAHDPLKRLHEILAVEANDVPRLVFNVRVDDYDFPDSIPNFYRIEYPFFRLAELWRRMLELHEQKIHNACPGLTVGDLWLRDINDVDGDGDSGSLLDLIQTWAAPVDFHEDMKFEPERVVFEEQTLGDCLKQLSEFTPAWSFEFDPDALLFRWRMRVKADGGASPMAAQTRTLNQIDDPAADFRHPVLSKQIAESAEDRWTKVEIVGPPEQIPVTIYLSNDELTKAWEVIDEIGWTISKARRDVGPAGVNASWPVWRRYRIAEGTRRRIARWVRKGTWYPGLPGVVTVDEIPDLRGRQYYSAQYLTFHRPVLAAKFTVGGYSGWFAVPARFDYLNGYAIAVNPLVLGDIRNPGTQWIPPDDVLLGYAYLSSRTVASYGPAGTAYTQLGLTNTMRFYEEDYFSTADQQINYQRLAKSLWRTRSDLIYTGSCVAAGIDYSFEGYNSSRSENFGRINFAGLDDSGAAVTTGWEAINAPVHEVEYDYANGLTTIGFNSDWSEYVLGDYQSLKLRVKERVFKRQQIAAWQELGGGPGFQAGIDKPLGTFTFIAGIRLAGTPESWIDPYAPGF